MSRIALRFLVSALAALTLAVIPLSAGASYVPCPYNDCHDVLFDTESRSIYGIWGQWSSVALNYGDARHVNNTLWIHVPDGSQPNGYDLLEMGLCNGGPSDLCWGATPGYAALYVAINAGSNPPDFHWIRWVALDGSTHKYAIMSSIWDGHGYPWQFYYDDGQGMRLVYSQDFPSQTASSNTAQVGGELQVNVSYGLDSTQSAGTFSDFVQLEYTDTSWHAWTSYNYHTDDPCGSYPPGQCFNAQIPSQSVWNWNKA